jgi:hypothetical protein
MLFQFGDVLTAKCHFRRFFANKPEFILQQYFADKQELCKINKFCFLGHWIYPASIGPVILSTFSWIMDCAALIHNDIRLSMAEVLISP